MRIRAAALNVAIPIILVASFASSPATADDSEPEPSSAKEDHGWSFDARAGAFAGTFHGLGVRRDSGALALFEGGLTPTRRDSAWKLEIPVRFHHRQTFGASLSETYGSAALEVQDRIAKTLRLGAEAGASGAWRPDWPDQYQPTSTGGLLPTDRYSYLEPRVGLNAWWMPAPRNHVRLKYRYVHYSYVHDRDFDAQLDPMHLTPRNNDQHQLEGSYRIVGDAYATAFRLEYGRREDSVYLAKDAISGSTNGYTNPTQQLATLEPSVEVEMKRLAGTVEVSLRYGYEIQDDLFQGYYSYTGHHPRLLVDWTPVQRLAVRARGELWWREYGPNSKAAGLAPDPTIGHLESGTRLYDHRGELSGTVSFALRRGLLLKATADYAARDTNYPDYVPGVYPSTKLYDIVWDYTNWQVLAGIEYRT